VIRIAPLATILAVVVAAAQVGAAQFIAKPYSADELLEAVS